MPLRLIGTILGNNHSRRENARDRQFSRRQYLDDMRATYGGEMSVVGNPHGTGSSVDVYGGKGSDLLGRDRDLEYSGKHLQQVFDVGAEQGLTPQEIAGSPAAGGTGRSGGNAVLGQSNAAASANQATLRNAAADRASNERIASMRTQADLAIAGIQSGVNVLGQRTVAETQRRGQDVQERVAHIAAEAGMYNARQIASAQVQVARIQESTALKQLERQRVVDAAQVDNISAQTALVMQSTAFEAVLHDERWSRLFSTMGPENVMAGVLARYNGVDMEAVLTGQPIDAETRETYRQFIDHVLSNKSPLVSEFRSIWGWIERDIRGTGRVFGVGD